MATKKELINSLLQEFLSTFQSSELYYEVNSVVKELMGFLSHLLVEQENIKLFFQFLPRIIFETPHQSEVTPLGHRHFYDIHVHEASAKKADSMRQFLEPFMLVIEQNCPDGLQFFQEYRPSLENAPSHSNERPDFRAFLPFSDVDSLKKLCKKTGISYERLKKETCFTTELENIPIYVNYSFDNIRKNGNLELHLFDPDEPYAITENLLRLAKEADNVLRNRLKKA